MPAYDRRLAVSMFLRSFFVQASWNFERLQNLGFAFLIAPVLKRRYGGDEKSCAAGLERHLDQFNTHPYFAGLVAGAVAREEGRSLDRGRFLEDLKRSLMSTLGSLGDGFFWSGLKPVAALASVVPALFGLWWAPLIFLVIFNGVHLPLRWWGVSAGLRYGCQVIRPISALAFADAVPALTVAASFLAGFGAGAAALLPAWRPVPGNAGVSLIVAVAVFALGALAGARRGRGRGLPGETVT